MKSLLAAGLAACLLGPAGALAEQVTVDTAGGPVDVQSEPETVAVFDMAALDTLAALGVAVDGAPSPVYLPYLEAAAEGATQVGTLFEPDFEALAVLGPDLIIIGGRSSPQKAALERIAPTIDMTIWGADMVGQARDRLSAYGEIFGRQAEAAELRAALDAKLEDARKVVQGKGDGLIILTNGGKISAYGDDSRYGWLHTALGLPESYPTVTAHTHGEAVSFEFLAEIDPEWLLVVDRGAAIGAGGNAAAATLDNPLVNGTSAARNGQIVYLDAGPVYIASGGIQSMLGTLDELIAAFGEVRSDN
ncbi:siderophore ABC transporter substrate-binding protein [Roseovarius indicus]|uniref:siderophore ABC transporter substrate-binding protein n=1 Tax=Roseovarius indicus TaxID=540747 RepID=UPI0007D8EB86|nr:siderophore ABC transporter substrate-binding protein [Roseovarius indicus]OAO03184.1 iron ABC transporter substrate-binding protein [Roseovarius indicus]